MDNLSEDSLISITCQLCDGRKQIKNWSTQEMEKCFRCNGSGEEEISLEDWVKKIIKRTVNVGFDN